MNNLFLGPGSCGKTQLYNTIQSKDYSTKIKKEEIIECSDKAININPLYTINKTNIKGSDKAIDNYELKILTKVYFRSSNYNGEFDLTFLDRLEKASRVQEENDTITIDLIGHIERIISSLTSNIKKTINVDLDTIDVKKLKEGDYSQLRSLTNIEDYDKIILKDLTINEKIDQSINDRIMTITEPEYLQKFKEVVEKVKTRTQIEITGLNYIEWQIENKDEEPLKIKALKELEQLLNKRLKIKNNEGLEILL